MNRNKVRVKVPASTANLGPGFDTLGVALNLYAWIDMRVSHETRIELFGKQMKGVPADKSNLVYQVAQQVFDKAGVSYPELEIAMYSDIPLTRGLGSSASAIIGGMMAANALIDYALSEDTIFQMACSIEKHPDNVGAALFGGIVVANWDGVRADYIRIEPDERLEMIVAIPEYPLATEKARVVLPKQVKMQDAIFNVSHSSLLVAALATGNLKMIQHAMKDRLHQPYRASLVPGMEIILQKAVDHGALGVALSGAGPTILAFVERDSDRKEELQQFLLDIFHEVNIPMEMMWLKPSLEGAKVLTPDDRNSLIEYIQGEVKA